MYFYASIVTTLLVILTGMLYVYIRGTCYQCLSRSLAPLTCYMQYIFYFTSHREKPLTLYTFTSDKSVKEKLTTRTSSGAINFNDVMMHFSGKNLVSQIYSICKCKHDVFINCKLFISCLSKFNWKYNYWPVELTALLECFVYEL